MCSTCVFSFTKSVGLKNKRANPHHGNWPFSNALMGKIPTFNDLTKRQIKLRKV
jgi:hypothetical protein